ncbi:MAG: sigma-70 family RNA polymerase sigma factor [Clostridium sp.]|nr:sigma-70 family RNA polymerase sigma factor [Clostridium sp.]
MEEVKALKLGDKNAFEKIYKLTYKKVYFFSFSITKDSELTKDIVQEIYVNVFKYIGSLKDEKLFIAWLNKITYNTTKKELSELNKKPINISDEELHMKLIDENNPVVKCIEDENTKELIQNVLNLKEKYRTVLILKYFNNYKIKDIAKLLDCPEGTVKSRLNTAKEILKSSLVKKYNKVIVLLGFSMILSLALTETAEASVVCMAPISQKGNSLKSKIKTVSTNKMLLTAATIYIIAVSIVIKNDITKEYKEKNVLVEYDDIFTNNSVEVSVKINNLDKDDSVRVTSITNNEEIITKKIDEELFLVNILCNGSYNLIINDKILSIININNIDDKAPIVKDNRKNGEILELFLSDNLSGIDYDKLEVISDEKKMNIINIDKETNKISIDLTKGTIYLKIFDNAGNESINRIDIE